MPVRAAAWTATAIPFALRSTQILGSSWIWLVNTLLDDAFYYLEAARRLAAGDGSTFDRPLWQWLLALLAQLFPDDEALARAALLAGVAMGLAALVIATRILTWAFGEPAALLAAAVVAWSNYTILVADGMESAMVVIGFVLLLASLARALRTGKLADAALAGLACALLVLARLHEVLFAGVVAVALVALGLERIGVHLGFQRLRPSMSRPTMSTTVARQSAAGLCRLRRSVDRRSCP